MADQTDGIDEALRATLRVALTVAGRDNLRVKEVLVSPRSRRPDRADTPPKRPASPLARGHTAAPAENPENPSPA